MEQFALVVQWSEPEVGVALYGPYASGADAEMAWPKVARDFSWDGEGDEVPEDVQWSVVGMNPR